MKTVTNAYIRGSVWTKGHYSAHYASHTTYKYYVLCPKMEKTIQTKKYFKPISRLNTLLMQKVRLFSDHIPFFQRRTELRAFIGSKTK